MHAGTFVETHKNKYRFQFEAFDLENPKDLMTSAWCNQFAIHRDLPIDGTLITLDMYREVETE
jgi:hypothetical protein